ncbi:hypothetical protein B0H14DRAFT_2642233 [Mycena olivaceomarginata]|nr:hypothetical protein B0H14DRAFT_2642233 [Mycena olivaceomarginata]
MSIPLDVGWVYFRSLGFPPRLRWRSRKAGESCLASSAFFFAFFLEILGLLLLLLSSLRLGWLRVRVSRWDRIEILALRARVVAIACLLLSRLAPQLIDEGWWEKGRHWAEDILSLALAPFLSFLPTSLLSFPHFLLLTSSAADYSLSHPGASSLIAAYLRMRVILRKPGARWACVFSLSLSLVLRRLDVLGFVFSDAGSGLGARCTFVHFMCRRVLDRVGREWEMEQQEKQEPEPDHTTLMAHELAFFFFLSSSPGGVLLSAVEWSESGVYREWGGTCSYRLVLERVSAVGWGRVVEWSGREGVGCVRIACTGHLSSRAWDARPLPSLRARSALLIHCALACFLGERKAGREGPKDRWGMTVHPGFGRWARREEGEGRRLWSPRSRPTSTGREERRRRRRRLRIGFGAGGAEERVAAAVRDEHVADDGGTGLGLEFPSDT